jgi:hypothetical protein
VEILAPMRVVPVRYSELPLAKIEPLVGNIPVSSIDRI